MEQFSKLSRPLAALTRKDATFVWSKKGEKNFQEMKLWLTIAPMSTLPKSHKPLVVYSYVSKLGLGHVEWMSCGIHVATIKLS